MKILYEGHSEADYLAKCHEALKTGLRRLYDVRCFGNGYDGFDPSLTSFPEIYKSLFPSLDANLAIVSFDFSELEGEKILYSDLKNLDIPKAVLIGDYWNYTGKLLDKFVKCIDNYQIDYIFTYFPQPLSIFTNTSIGDRFIHVLPTFDPQLFNDWGVEKKYDVGFLAVGTTEYTHFYPERFEIHNKLHARKDLRYLWANHPGWERRENEHPLVGRFFSEAINSCNIFITTSGIYKTPNPKYIEILASGSALMAERPEGAEAIGLVDGFNYIEFTRDTFDEKLDYYLANPEKVRSIGMEGYSLAMERHNCYARAVQIGRALSDRLGRRNNKKENNEMNIEILKQESLHPTLNISWDYLMDDNREEPGISYPSDLGKMPISSSPQYTLYRLVRQLKPKSILEIGTQIGASAVACALAMRDNCDVPNINCIDPFLTTGDNDGLPSLVDWYGVVHKSGYLCSGISLFLGFSDEFFRVSKSTYDFIIVDGSHEYHQVKADFKNALKCLNSNGYIWLHDYMIYESVRNAINEVVEEEGVHLGVNRIQSNDRGDLCGWAIVKKAKNKQETFSKMAINVSMGTGYVGAVLSKQDQGSLSLNIMKPTANIEPGNYDQVILGSAELLESQEIKELLSFSYSLLTKGGQVVMEKNQGSNIDLTGLLKNSQFVNVASENRLNREIVSGIRMV